MPKSAENRTFCAKNAQKMRKKRGSPHFLALFGALSGIGGNPLSVQINVFAVWPLRLNRKYTSLIWQSESPYPPIWGVRIPPPPNLGSERPEELQNK